MNVIQIIEAILAAVGLGYTIMTGIAQSQPTTKLGLFCARWAGTTKHIVEAKPELLKGLEAISSATKALRK